MGISTNGFAYLQRSIQSAVNNRIYERFVFRFHAYIGPYWDSLGFDAVYNGIPGVM